MNQEKKTSCCGAGTGAKNIRIDFLYLDLHSCGRCGDTSVSLDEAVSEVCGVLTTLGFTLSVNKVRISSPELATQYRFMSSPTIRVNGKDICTDLKENDCKDCGDLCRSDVDCRVFAYEGKDYDVPPKAMIVDAILRAIYQPSPCDCGTYTMSENLQTFFTGKSASCCEAGGCCNERSRVNQAVNCFQNGFNCAQAVLTTYCEDFGLERETALKLSCSLGGGMGRLGHVCGAVSGALLLLGLKHGQSLPYDNAAKEATYTQVQEFSRSFEKRNGSVLCRDLLGVDLLSGDKAVAAERVKSVCPKMVQDAAEIIEEMLF